MASMAPSSIDEPQIEQVFNNFDPREIRDTDTTTDYSLLHQDRFHFALVDLYKIFNAIVGHNPQMKDKIGDYSDIPFRIQLYEDLLNWRGTLVTAPQNEYEERGKYIFLR